MGPKSARLLLHPRESYVTISLQCLLQALLPNVSVPMAKWCDPQGYGAEGFFP